LQQIIALIDDRGVIAESFDFHTELTQIRFAVVGIDHRFGVPGSCHLVRHVEFGVDDDRSEDELNSLKRRVEQLEVLSEKLCKQLQYVPAVHEKRPQIFGGYHFTLIHLNRRLMAIGQHETEARWTPREITLDGIPSRIVPYVKRVDQDKFVLRIFVGFYTAQPLHRGDLCVEMEAINQCGIRYSSSVPIQAVPIENTKYDAIFQSAEATSGSFSPPKNIDQDANVFIILRFEKQMLPANDRASSRASDVMDESFADSL